MRKGIVGQSVPIGPETKRQDLGRGELNAEYENYYVTGSPLDGAVLKHIKEQFEKGVGVVVHDPDVRRYLEQAGIRPIGSTSQDG